MHSGLEVLQSSKCVTYKPRVQLKNNNQNGIKPQEPQNRIRVKQKGGSLPSAERSLWLAGGLPEKEAL